MSCFNKSIKIIFQSMDVHQWGCAHCRKYSPCFMVTTQHIHNLPPHYLLSFQQKQPQHVYAQNCFIFSVHPSSFHSFQALGKFLQDHFHRFAWNTSNALSCLLPCPFPPLSSSSPPNIIVPIRHCWDLLPPFLKQFPPFSSYSFSTSKHWPI